MKQDLEREIPSLISLFTRTRVMHKVKALHCIAESNTSNIIGMILSEQQGCFKPERRCILKLTDYRAEGDAEAADKVDAFVVNFPAFKLYLSEFDTPLCGWRS